MYPTTIHTQSTHPATFWRSSFKDNWLFQNDEEFNNELLEDTRKMVCQGLLDNCEDYFVSVLDLEAAQAP